MGDCYGIMASWTLDDIPWASFDAALVDPDILRIVKAASLVEGNGSDYAQYLCGIFHDDLEFHAIALRWGEEEVQHGRALGRWAALADPGFDFETAKARFTKNFRVDLGADSSSRGSRAGEMVARCVVETGTSSYYSALAEAAREPVLRELCRRIAADEFRHYRLFLGLVRRYDPMNRLGLIGRLRIVFQRVRESEDDELALAYHTANGGSEPYDRLSSVKAYSNRAYRLYRRHHVERVAAMILKTMGLPASGKLGQMVSGIAWWLIQSRVKPEAA